MMTARSAIMFAAFAAVSGVVSPTSGESLPFSDLADVRGPYDGVGAEGEALYVCTLGNADGWPICAYWSSARTERSPLFGYGWCIPALESRFYSIDERRWAFHQPDGYVRIFVRAERGKSNVLFGGSAWTATLDGDSARIVADPGDGGPKSVFAFSQGRLVGMSCEEGDFRIGYKDRVAERIVSRGKTVLEIVRRKPPSSGVELRFNGNMKNRVVAICRDAPVFVADGDSEAVRTEQRKCLAELTMPDGRKIPFSYGGDGEEAFFSAADDRWTWDPRSRLVVSHGEWAYRNDGGKSVRRGGDMYHTPSFSRIKSDGKWEGCSLNRNTGVREESFVDGSSRRSQVFTSGPFAWRRVRWIEETPRDGGMVRTDFTYDEQGRLVFRRVREEGGSTEESWFDGSGDVVRRRVDGKVVMKK